MRLRGVLQSAPDRNGRRAPVTTSAADAPTGLSGAQVQRAGKLQEVAMYRSDLPLHIKSDMLALSVCLTAILFKLIDITWGAIF